MCDKLYGAGHSNRRSVGGRTDSPDRRQGLALIVVRNTAVPGGAVEEGEWRALTRERAGWAGVVSNRRSRNPRAVVGVGAGGASPNGSRRQSHVASASALSSLKSARQKRAL